MENRLATLWGFLAGKKTYLAAGILAITVLVLVFFQRLTPTTGITVALIFLAVISATFRSALAAHQAQVLAVLGDTAALGKATLGKNSKAAASAGIALVTDGSVLVSELKQEEPAQ